MVIHTRRTPKTSTQRSREFRERNPHYHRDYRRRKEAEHQAYLAAQAEIKALPLLVPLLAAELNANPTTTPLALPVPAETTTIQLPLFATPQPELLYVQHATRH